ncbi:hypothetical protein [Mucilaginibacter sp. L3T2-6]|nr:hypothetical protein [Mucilaginibacter sp. L3T2-6]MDO3641685.1 hypothetical protein [Mucilaginibacter sp. L3T2-6]MDV6214179.1 hypothetical protein [Mucilaginibacter sp. L3T2-6]
MRENIFYTFYTLCFLASFLSGIATSFTGTHTAPLPFLVELLALPIGLFLFLIALVLRNSLKVHKFGLLANGAIMALVLLLYFR